MNREWKSFRNCQPHFDSPFQAPPVTQARTKSLEPRDIQMTRYLAGLVLEPKKMIDFIMCNAYGTPCLSPRCLAPLKYLM